MAVTGGIISEGGEIADAGALRIWANAWRVIVVLPGPLSHPPTLRDLLRALDEGRGPRDAPALLLDVARRAGAHSGLAALALDERVATAEEREESGLHARAFDDAVALRGRLLALRRHLMAQRDALARFSQLAMPWSAGQDAAWREAGQCVLETVDRIDALVERVHALQDRIAQRTAAATNRVLYVITAFTAVFAPLSFVAGVFGMNVGIGEGSIPGFAAPPMFAALALVLVVVGAGELLLLRRLRR
jgi:hypothetical protein